MRTLLTTAALTIVLAAACGSSTPGPSSSPPPASPSASSLAPSAGPSARPTSCAEINSLVSTKLLQSALAAYADRAAAGEQCQEPSAFRAAVQAADTTGRLGDAYRRASAANLARAQYLKALAIDAEQPLALAGIQTLDRPPTTPSSASPSASIDPMAIAQSLYDAGYETEARAQVQKAIEANPSATISSDLDGLGSWPTGPPRDLLRLAVDLVPWLIILSVLLLLLGFFRDRLRRPRAELGTFDAKAIDDKYGSSIPKLIMGELSRMEAEGAGRSLGFVNGPDPAIELPTDIAEVVPHGKLVAALLSLIPWRRKPYRIEGTAQPRGDRGFGLTISIVSPRGSVTSETIWEADVDPLPPEKAEETEQAAILHRLALGATAWLLYSLPDPSQLYLTDDFKSYMSFRIGASWFEDGDQERARIMYDRALRNDSSNRGALFNLAVLDAQSTKATATARLQDYEVAARRFDLSRDLLLLAHRRATTSVYLDRLWFRMTYNIAAVALHRYLDRIGAGPMTEAELASLKAARNQLRICLGVGEKVLVKFREDDRQYGGLVRFVREVQVSGAVLLADIVQRDERLRAVQSVIVPPVLAHEPSFAVRLRAAKRAFETGMPS